MGCPALTREAIDSQNVLPLRSIASDLEVAVKDVANLAEQKNVRSRRRFWALQISLLILTVAAAVVVVTTAPFTRERAVIPAVITVLMVLASVGIGWFLLNRRARLQRSDHARFEAEMRDTLKTFRRALHRDRSRFRLRSTAKIG